MKIIKVMTLFFLATSTLIACEAPTTNKEIEKEVGVAAEATASKAESKDTKDTKKDVKKEVDLKGLKCPVVQQLDNCDTSYCDLKVEKDFSAKYKGGTVYFCCKKCVKAFNEDSKKYDKHATAQLVKTKQIVEKKENQKEE